MIGGDDLARDPQARQERIGYIPDRPFLYEKLSGGRVPALRGGLWGQEGRETEARADRLLELFSLSDWRDELVESYTHGMRQKLLISLGAACTSPS